jgi:hypothetical protein
LGKKDDVEGLAMVVKLCRFSKLRSQARWKPIVAGDGCVSGGGEIT